MIVRCMTARSIVVLLLLLQINWCRADTISHWPMDGSGTAEIGVVVPDIVGGNDGFVINDPLEYVEGNADSPSALRFEAATQDKIEVLDDPTLHFDLAEDSFTMETVFRVADSASGRPAPFGKNGSAAGDSQYWARVRADQSGGIQFLVRGDAGDGPGGDLPPERIATTNRTVTDGLWHHFAAVYTAGEPSIELYVDYTLDTTIEVDPADGIIGDNEGGLILGGFTSSSREFDGDIADIRFSDTALTPNQFLPENVAGLRQTQVAGDVIGAVQLDSEVSDVSFSEPEQTNGLAQYWYEGSMRNNVQAFLDAGDTGSEANPLINQVPFASRTTWWAGGQNVNVISDITLPNYPDGLRGTRFEGSNNEDAYGVRLTGEIFIPENGEYLLRDGIDDFAMIAIDQDGNGELDDLDSVVASDVGAAGFGDVLVLDDDWADIDGGSQTVDYHGLAEFENVPADGDWRAIEIWMSEGSGGDAAILYMANTDDENLFDETNMDALTQEERDAFVVRNDRLRSTASFVASGKASAALRDDVEYVMQVSADGNDQFVIDDNGGVYDTTLSVENATVRVFIEGELEPGTTIELFDADSIVGTESFTLLLDDADLWDLSQLSTGSIVFQTTTSSCVTGRQGDVNGDGVVDFPDFLILSNTFGQNAADIASPNADFDCSGDIGFADFLILSDSFGMTVGAETAHVPEPACLALFVLGLTFAGHSQRRRRR